MRKVYGLTVVLLIMSLWVSGCGNVYEPEPEVKVYDHTGRYELDTERGEAVINDVNFNSGYDIPGIKDNNRVFYEIFVGSFSDSNGDGIGDLRGIINRFDYLNDGDPESGLSLGVEGIWLSPIFKSPSYHKYDVTDYYEIDEQFGTMEDLRELVDLCHERNVKIILDLVINHTSKENKWFKEFCSARRHSDSSNQYYDYYVASDTESHPGKIFYKIPSGDEYYEGNFSSDMPELNYDNPIVRKEVLKIAEYYLQEIGVDGFRFDAAKYVYLNENDKNVEFWSWYMEKIREMDPSVYCVAEVWDSDSVTKDYAVCMNCFDFTMAQADGMISATAKRGDVNKYTSYVEQYIDNVHSKNELTTIVPFIANHDTDRAAGYMTLSSGYAKVAANLYILGPGSPFIYYGEEIGLKGSRGSANTDANRRLAMLWGDDDTIKNPTGSTFDSNKQTNGTVDGQKKDGDSLYNYYKRLIMLRKANPEIALGDYRAYKFKNTKFGGFVSTYEGNSVSVFHNTSGSEISVDLSAVTDQKSLKITDVIGMGDASLDGDILTVSGQTSVILR